MMAKTNQFLQVMMVLVKIKQFLVGYDGDGLKKTVFGR